MKKKLLLFSFMLIGVSAISEPIEDFPIREIIRFPTKEEMCQRFLNEGKQLMELKGIPDGDENMVCTNWICPTTIVVNSQQYVVVTNKYLSFTFFKVMTTNEPPVEVASGDIDILENGKIARRMTFANCATTSFHLTDYAPRLDVWNLDPSTNAIVITNYRHPFDKCDLSYKNIRIKTNASTNAIDFSAEIINAGLPEEERIPLPPAP